MVASWAVEFYVIWVDFIGWGVRPTSTLLASFIIIGNLSRFNFARDVEGDIRVGD
jgi:hypothetical protein